ncbi:MAG TPA: hypothetical protein VJH34_01045, partial [archaeon]|nr:hypothetical protein [archaeon]
HPMIQAGFKLPKPGKLTSYFITDYRILDGDRIQVDSASSVSEVDWMRENGDITDYMAKLLGANPKTYVLTNPDKSYHEGLRALGWAFRGRGGPDLNSYWNPSDRGPALGSLLGRVVA